MKVKTDTCMGRGSSVVKMLAQSECREFKSQCSLDTTAGPSSAQLNKQDECKLLQVTGFKPLAWSAPMSYIF